MQSKEFAYFIGFASAPSATAQVKTAEVTMPSMEIVGQLHLKRTGRK
jgi:hypothetical protein